MLTPWLRSCLAHKHVDGHSSDVTRSLCWQWLLSSLRLHSLNAGASEDLAKAYAEELARKGVNIILISPDGRGVEGTAKAIADSHGVAALSVQADFSKGHAVCRPIRDVLKDKDIGFLITSMDVSLSSLQAFAGLPEDHLWDAVSRNVAAATLLARIVLPGMAERGRGAVVNISSGLCCKPTPNKVAFTAITVSTL